MTRVLLFGASGFLGRQVAARLRAQTELISPGRSQCDLLEAGPVELTRLVRSAAPDAVVACAGALAGNGYQLMRANALVTAKLIEAVAAAAPRARLVRIGSAGEYGPVPPGTVSAESDPAHPAGDYGVSHLAGTRLLELATAAGRVDGITLRVFNPVGAGMGAETVIGRAAELIRSALITGAGRVVLGPLDAYRDLVDVRDVAQAVGAAVLSRRPRPPILNVGSGHAVAIRTAVEQLAVIAGFAGEIHEQPAGAIASRSTGVPWSCADISAAGRVLGWRPGYSLPESLAALWDTTAAAGIGARSPIAGAGQR